MPTPKLHDGIEIKVFLSIAFCLAAYALTRRQQQLMENIRDNSPTIDAWDVHRAHLKYHPRRLGTGFFFI